MLISNRSLLYISGIKIARHLVSCHLLCIISSNDTLGSCALRSKPKIYIGSTALKTGTLIDSGASINTCWCAIQIAWSKNWPSSTETLRLWWYDSASVNLVACTCGKVSSVLKDISVCLSVCRRLKVYIGLSVCAPIYCTHCILFWFTLYKALGLRLYFYQKTNQKEKLSCGSAGKKCAFSYLIYNFGNLLNKNIQKSFEMFSSYNLYCRMC